MADSQSTPNTKPASKPAPYEPTTNANSSSKADRPNAAKADATAASKADKPAPTTAPTTADKSAHATADKSATSSTDKATTAKADESVPRLTALTIRIDPESAELLSVEGLDSTGSRWVLSAEEKSALLKGGGRAERFQAVVERAFEAGIASVLGDGDDEDETEEDDETAEDTDIRRTLLAPLIARSAIRRYSERTVLNRAILGTLLEHSLQADASP